MLFLGGVKRIASGGQLGFHQFYLGPSVSEAVKSDRGKSISSTQELMGLLVIYFEEMSIDPALLFLASFNDRESLFSPKSEAMLKLGVTNVNEIPSFSGWTIEPYRSGAVVTGKLSGGFVEDQQITFFCRANSPGKVYMLASRQYDYHAPDDDRGIRTAIWGSSVSIAGKSFGNRLPMIVSWMLMLIMLVNGFSPIS
jgi:hypothetical protein